MINHCITNGAIPDKSLVKERLRVYIYSMGSAFSGRLYPSARSLKTIWDCFMGPRGWRALEVKFNEVVARVTMN